MKKKGLIISTVVMVVVLIASLTTATYAWFSASATAKVDDISMAVGASSKVQIGMRKSTATGTSVTDYKSGQITFATGGEMATGEYDGLGNLLSTGISLDVTAGVGTSANGNDMDAAYTKANALYKASGSSFDELGALTAARINGEPSATQDADKTKADVINFALGVRASQADVYGTYAKLTITIPQNQTYMGMITALYAEIKVGSKTYEGDIFAELAHFDTTTATGATDNKVTFYFMIDEKGTNALSTTGNVTPFSIKLFISGYDTRDCVDNATGTGATISLDFDGCATDWTADAAWHQLTLA